MKYSVVHSNDPYLLARLATDLQMEGVNVEDWESWAVPFEVPGQNAPVQYLHNEPSGSEFQNHGYCNNTPNNRKYELTESNYLTVLEAILCD